MGKFLTSQGEKIAVLAVDPSSTTTGGAVHNTFCIDVIDILSLHFSARIIDG
jgi:hypothetical protein